ncbi:helix-turn-helix domain-containing protein [Candidatus Symbiopectobacterium sp. 'North America']|uniref:helix-turn-helix domain-containing protein n=1 Tax=Candidatus Symbiopectobacterium sp. 'North America' TaxID=2794574 RepID=UPI0018C99F42|nr:helix-turn-helix domain-containing protein [Candidatus Symbiopectobacterium sp. 'North America']
MEARVSQIEYDLIVEALSQFQGNISRAAEHLNITRRALGLRLDKYRLNYKHYRNRA